jgi:hypothetical protein
MEDPDRPDSRPSPAVAFPGARRDVRIVSATRRRTTATGKITIKINIFFIQSNALHVVSNARVSFSGNVAVFGSPADIGETAAKTMPDTMAAARHFIACPPGDVFSLKKVLCTAATFVQDSVLIPRRSDKTINHIRDLPGSDVPVYCGGIFPLLR